MPSSLPLSGTLSQPTTARRNERERKKDNSLLSFISDRWNVWGDCPEEPDLAEGPEVPEVPEVPGHPESLDPPGYPGYLDYLDYLDYPGHLGLPALVFTESHRVP